MKKKKIKSRSKVRPANRKHTSVSIERKKSKNRLTRENNKRQTSEANVRVEIKKHFANHNTSDQGV